MYTTLNRPTAAHDALRWCLSFDRTPRRVARLVLLGTVLVMAVFAHARDAQAQGVPQNKAGVVIDFGGGSVFTACVDLGADGQATGEELLQTAGFDVLIEYSSQGGAVCKIGAQGCNYPDQNCWCQCMSSPCVYWAYNHLAGSQWLYSAQGASSYVVHSGEVDGWAWGAGTVALGAQPPVTTFDQICAPPTATPTSTATWTPVPTLTPTTAATIWVPWPTTTPTPTTANTGTPTSTWTPNPTATPTPTWTAGPPPTATPDLAVTSTISPVPTATLTPIPAIATVTPGPAILATATPGTLAATPLSPGPTVATPLGQTREQARYLPFVQSGADGPTMISSETASAPVAGVITATLAPTATLAAALPASPAGGAAAHLASARAVDKTSNEEAGWLQNAPFSAETEAAWVTQAAPDPVWPVLLVLVLAGVLAGLRLLRRVSVRSAALAISPRAVGGALSGSVAGLQRSFAANAGRRTSLAAAPSGLLSLGIYGLTAGIGLLALLQPFLTAALGNTAATNGANAPLLVTVLMALCFLALLFEVQGQTVSAKMIALLGVLVAINSVLRFV